MSEDKAYKLAKETGKAGERGWWCLDPTDTPKAIKEYCEDALVRVITSYGPKMASEATSEHLIHSWRGAQPVGLYFGSLLYTMTKLTKIMNTTIVYMCKTFSSSQLPPSIAQMKHFVWLMDQWRVLAGWRSASTECGEECVVDMTGITMRPELCANNWDIMSTQVSSF